LIPLKERETTKAIMADASTDSEVVFKNGRFFSKDQPTDGSVVFQSCMIVKDGIISHIGTESDSIISDAKSRTIPVQDLGGRVVLPGFVDAHMHLLLFGQSLQKLDLGACHNLQDIRTSIKEYAQKHPNLARILCRGWMQSMTDGVALASMIDDLDRRPIFIDSKDMHSTWCNSAGLKELGDDIKEDSPGSVISRDEHGNASGLLSEGINFTKVWPHLAKSAPMEQKLDALRVAMREYTEAGSTGLVEMAMDEHGGAALLLLKDTDEFNMRISAYWLITPSDDADSLVQVDRAIELSNKYKTSADLKIVGIKCICDGVIDGCTAALLEPYSNGENPDLLWKEDVLAAVVKKANDAGLQCALHAIGDRAVHVAINTIEAHCSPSLRPRIEHLELTTEEDAKRLGAFGITASIQPVHAGPAILRAWPGYIGDRVKRAFAYREFADGGATLAIGTDSPTAPHLAFPNLYTATTRRSPKDDGKSETVNEEFALTLCEAITGATAGAAYSVFEDSRLGSLRAGAIADFVIVDMEMDPKELLKAQVYQTWYRGKLVFDSTRR
jgi:predicted amidohydrolase YtcJ